MVEKSMQDNRQYDFDNREDASSIHDEETNETTELLSSEESSSMTLATVPTPANKEKWRNLIGFWWLGLTNNFGYVLMLSAAHDILSGGFNNDSISEPQANVTNPRGCNDLSTGTILLADILPCLIVKTLAPFLPACIHPRVSLVVLLNFVSMLMVGNAVNSTMAIIGVVFTSLASGLGESTFLAYSTNYKSTVISTWSSGTGGAGIFGALSYAGLTTIAGFTAKQTILLMLVVPCIMAVTFWFILEHPGPITLRNLCACSDLRSSEPKIFDLDQSRSTNSDQSEENLNANTSLKQKLKAILPLFKYMIPLNLVYLGEYIINQGLSELLYFPGAWLDRDEQYRWYQVIYQVGVFLSRSSVNLFHFKKIWITSVLQWINVVIFMTGAIYLWFGSIWVAFAFILWEGFLGGAAYVNTFYRVSNEVHTSEREFAVQITSMSDTYGIALAGFLAIPLHNYICDLPLM